MKKNLLFSFLCLFSIQLISQTLKETDKLLPEELWNMTYRNHQGRAVAIDGDYAVISSEGYNFASQLVLVIHKNGNEWEKVATLRASDNETEDYFGHTLSISGNNIIVGAYGDDDNGSKSGSVYVFTKPEEGWTDMTETAKLKASDGDNDDEFGFTLSISGDNLVVGCGFGADKEKAYVFTKPTNGWEDMNESAILTASDNIVGDRFGNSVSISGENIVVGAFLHDNNGDRNGAAYVFTKPIDGWVDATETAKLTVSDGSTIGSFGSSVGISGDKIVVGASSVSAAYVFVKPLGDWVDATQTAKLTPTESLSSTSQFGGIVSISGSTILIGAPGSYWNWGRAYYFREPESGWVNASKASINNVNDLEDGDYYACSVGASGNTLIIGAYGTDTDNNTFDSGVTYIHTYDEASNTLYKKEVLVPTYDSILQSFGQYVSIDGDYAVVSTSSYDVGTGYVYVLYNNKGSWEKVARLTPSIRRRHSDFGSSVSISGDVVVVGSSGDFESIWYEGYGAAYVYVKPETGWTDMTQTAKLKASDRAENDWFGISVSISGDYIVVGSRGDDDNGSFSGSAYVFTKPSGGWINMTETAKLLPSDGAESDEFGGQLCIFGDNIIVGARYDDDNGSNSGSAYIFTKPSGGWINMTETAKLLPSDGSVGGGFGRSVSIFNDNAVIGGLYKDEHGDIFRAAYVFTKPSGGWSDMTETAKLQPSDGYSGLSFGDNVSIYEDIILVCANNDDENGTNSGSVYVYVRPKHGWVDTTQSFKLISSDAAVGDLFGSSASISGNNFVVGATGNDEKANNAGAVYFYKRENAVINNQPKDQRVNYGTQGSFSITTSNANHYQWQRSYDDGINFNDIVNDNLYTGAQTTVLKVVGTESINNYKYRCIVSNLWGSVISEFAKLTLNYAPINLELTATSIDEEVAVGETVGILIVTDNDDQDSFTIKLISGDGTNDSGNESFIIESNILKSNEIFDYEKQSKYNIYVEATDEGGLSFKKVFVISINDVTETGLSNLEKVGISVYPNPTNGIMNINFSDNKKYDVRVYDLLGKVIFEKNNISQIETIDISNYDNGLYILSLQNGEKVITCKIVKK